MGVSLLIIEEDSLFQKNLAQRLRLEKFKIYFANQDAEAEKIIKRKEVDVVLLGLNGLKREGLMILKTIKKIKPLTEVIIINSSEQIALSIEGMKLGAFDDFFAPFDIDSLIDRIRDAYQEKKIRYKNKAAPLQPRR